MSLSWLFSMRQSRQKSQAMERLRGRITAYEAIRDACKRDLAALTGLSLHDQALSEGKAGTQ
jgi:hypothetical protein